MVEPKKGESKFTPGPWACDPEYRSSNGYLVVYQDNKDGLGLEAYVCQLAPESEEANARLIAAAPDMYELLRIVLTYTKNPATQARIDHLLSKVDGG